MTNEPCHRCGYSIDGKCEVWDECELIVLRRRVDALRTALENIRTHTRIVAGSMSALSGTMAIATAALAADEEATTR